jgi:hypothetical protein
MHTHVVDNLDFYLMNGVISNTAAKHLLEGKDAAVKRFLPFMNAAVEGLGNLPITHIYPPIARDYVAFNAQQDVDKADSAGEKFDPAKGATQASQRIARM